MSDNRQTSYNNEHSTNIVSGTSVQQTYELYLDMKNQIAELEDNCNLLVDKYHYEMCHTHIPCQFAEDSLYSLFNKNEETCKLARKHFLELCFSSEFLVKFNVDFVQFAHHGYTDTAISIILSIGNHLYSVEIPIPKNIYLVEDKTRLMGKVKFRVDRLHKSEKDKFVKKWTSIQMPTYDWKECFEAIEADAEKEAV